MPTPWDEVPESAECVSPEKLSANDGILSIEGVGAFIKQEAIKFSPPIGRSKSRETRCRR